MAANARNLIVETAREALNAMSDVNSEDDFQTQQEHLVERTRSMFYRQTQGTTKKKRGRPHRPCWKPKVVLLDQPYESLRQVDMKKIQERGFGTPTVRAKIHREWSLEKTEEYLRGLYPMGPVLSLTGLTFMRAERGFRKTLRPIIPESVTDLQGQLRAGCLFLTPNRRIPEANEIEADQEWNEEEELQENTPIMIEEQIESNEGEELPGNAMNEEDNENNEGEELPDLTPVMESQGDSTEIQTPHENRPVTTPSPTPTAPALEESESSIHRQELNLLNEALSVLERSLADDESIVNVRREDVEEQLLQLYATDPSIAARRLHVVFLNESGDDFGGLSKEMFTAFWSSAFENYFVGENVKIPFLPLHKIRKDLWKFKAIGCILSHSVAITKTLPSLLSITSIIAIVFQDVDQQCLLKDFLLYCTEHERTLIQKALDDYDSLSSREFDSLVSLYSIHGFLELPNKVEVLDQITEIARDVLVQKPRLLYEALRNGIPQLHLEQFWTQLSIDAIGSLIHLQRPSPKKVAESLSAEDEPLTPDQDKVLYFLNEYILGLDQDDLLEFLHFTTGSIHMPSDGIKVSFNSLLGSLRRPIAHTCSNLLELSTFYSSFQEFKREMRVYLRSQSSFEFSIL